MFKYLNLRFIAIFAMLVFGNISVQASVVTSLTLTDFNISWNPGLTSKYGGTATVHSSQTQDFEIDVSAFDKIFDFPKEPVLNFLKPKAGTGVFFEDVINYGAWGQDQNVYLTSNGIAFETSKNGNFDEGMVFLPGLAQWTIQVGSVPVSSVPEPPSYAMVCVGLMMMTMKMIRKRNQEKEFDC